MIDMRDAGRRWLLCSSLAAGLTLAGIGAAAGSECDEADPAAVAATDTPRGTGGSAPASASGRQVAIDPASGARRDLTPAEAQALSAAMARLLGRAPSALRTVSRPDGTRVVSLVGAFLSMTTVAIGADGSREYSCRQIVPAPAPPPSPCDGDDAGARP